MTVYRVEPDNDLTVVIERRTGTLTSLPGVIWCHGGGDANGNAFGLMRNNEQLILGPDQSYGVMPPRAIVEAGYKILAPAFGAPFGTAPAWDILDDAYDRLVADGHPTKVHLMAGSGGACNALNWLWRNPSKVASAFLYVPLVDVEALYDRDGTYRAAIEAAYGQVPTQTDYDNYDPSHNHANILPHVDKIKVWYGTNDTVLPAGSVEAFIAAMGCEYTETAASHLNGFLPAYWDELEPIRWFNAHND